MNVDPNFDPKSKKPNPPPAVPPPPPPQPGDMVNPFRRPFADPVFTYGMLAVIVAIFAYQIFFGGLLADTRILIEWGANVGPLILYNGEWWRLFAAMFLHLDITHIAFNGFALYTLGRDMEALYGWRRYAAVYLLSGLGGNILSLLWRGPAEYSVGASGAIFGIAGMTVAFFFFYRKRLGDFGRERYKAMLRLVAINLVIGLVIVQINNMAHLGGLITGTILGYALVPRYILHKTADEVDGLYAAPTLKVVDEGALPRMWWAVAVTAGVLFLLYQLSFVVWV